LPPRTPGSRPIGTPASTELRFHKTYFAGSGKRYYWLCPRGHDYLMSATGRTQGRGCPVCSGQKIMVGFNDLLTTHPEIAATWNPEAKTPLTPERVTAGSNRTGYWICPIGHRYSLPISKRVDGQGWQYCSNRKVLSGFNDLQTRYPLIASDWHPSKNGNLTAHDVVPGNVRRWWEMREPARTIRHSAQQDQNQRVHRLPVGPPGRQRRRSFQQGV
jgi:Probable Zinc-ribbon domain